MLKINEDYVKSLKSKGEERVGSWGQALKEIERFEADPSRVRAKICDDALQTLGLAEPGQSVALPEDGDEGLVKAE